MTPFTRVLLHPLSSYHVSAVYSRYTEPGAPSEVGVRTWSQWNSPETGQSCPIEIYRCDGLYSCEHARTVQMYRDPLYISLVTLTGAVLCVGIRYIYASCLCTYGIRCIYIL